MQTTIHAQDLPWLLLPTNPFKCNTRYSKDIKSFLSITTKKLHNFYLPLTRGKTICGSSAGWLIFLDDVVSTLTLINPLNSAHIQLPQISTKKVLIHKAILSSDPECDPYNFVVIAICGEKRQLVHYKARSESWKVIEAAGYYYDDVISYQEQNKFFAVNEYGKVVSFKINDGDDDYILPDVKEIFMPFSFEGNKVYLACIKGELFVIFRSLRDHDPSFGYETVRFSVYVLNVKDEIVERIRSFPGVAFFLGHNHSTWLLEDEAKGVIGNRIYFTDDCSGAGGVSGRDVGCYDMKDSSIDRLRSCYSDANFKCIDQSRPVYFM